MYDSISVPLPDATDVRTLPSVCHEEGAWNRFISELDICRIRNELQQNCSQSFCDAFNVPTPVAALTLKSYEKRGTPCYHRFF